MFRQQALAQVSARDTLEDLLTVTSPRLWLALAACMAVIAAAVVWAVTGSAPTTVTGIGIILPANGVVNVTALDTGTLTTLPLVGHRVKAGEQVATLTVRGHGTIPVTAPVTGMIDQELAARGDFVQPGTPIAEMLPSGAPLSGLLFVTTGEGKALKRGMQADISPSTAPSSQYGSITGTVDFVSPLPLTNLRLAALLGDRPGLIAQISQLGSPLEVAVTLHRDLRTPSGYAWTSGTGPGFRVTPGTPLTGTVVVARQNPASSAFSGQ